MTEFLSIQQAIDQKEGNVAIRGWVYRERGSNKLKFIVLRDSSNIIQCVADADNFSQEEFEKLHKLQIETSMIIWGKIKKDDRAPTGYEISMNKFEIVGECDTFPIQKDQSPEFLLDNRHLWIRSRKMTAIMKIRSTILEAIHDFFKSKGYYEFTPPIMQPNQCEGGSTLFEVKYYNEITYLSQSWQLYAEAAIFSLERVYCISPTFRAERSKTSRHLSEFWMAEMEAAWIDLKQASEIAKEEIRFIIKKVLENNRNELESLGRDVKILERYAEADYPTITYDDALKILKEKRNVQVAWGKDLRTIEEDELMKELSSPIIVTNYPKEIMAFYKPRDPKNPKTALCFDMLAPEGYGEIIGGSQRDTDIQEIENALKKDGEDPNNYKFYLDLRKYGSVPHSGYGLGVERVISWICCLDNIKDAIPFPRTMLRKGP